MSRRPKSAPPPGPAPPHAPKVLDRLEQVRVLAHPLRLRLIEVFAEEPCTPKQAAERLGVPPTRLYHHVAVLERLGLVRVKETRRNRGTIEKHYEAVASGFEMDPAHFVRGRSRSARQAAARLAGASAAALAMRVVERAAEGLAEAIEAISDPDLAPDDPRRPIAIGAGIRGTPKEVAEIRDELLGLFEKWGRDAKAKEKTKPASAEPPMKAWLTIVLVPEPGTGSEPLAGGPTGQGQGQAKGMEKGKARRRK